MFKLLLGSGQEFGIPQSLTLLTFFAIFVGVIIWALLAKKDYIKHMSELPIKDQNSLERENINYGKN